MATKKQQQRQAAKHLKLKLTQERQLASDIRTILNRQNQRFFDAYSSSGLVIDASLFELDISTALNRSYRDTTAKFAGFVMDDLNDTLAAAGLDKVDADNPEILAVLLMFIQQNVQKSTGYITATSNKNMVKAVSIADGDPDKAYALLQDKNIPRSQIIAMTEVQKASEGSKQIIAQQAAKVAGGFAIGRKILTIIKTWMTMGDSSVRAWHSAARFQEVPIDDPFIVGGEFLMFPGDDSLGASLDNIMGCRCVSLTSSRIG